jgi:hypothetical protein
MATKRELKRDLDAVVRPRRMAVSAALSMPDRNRALLAIYHNVDRGSAPGGTIAWAFEAMLKVNSSGVPIMFLEWSPADVSRARGALLEVGASDAVSAIDKVFNHIGVDGQLDALPDEAVQILLSEEFDEWKRQHLPEPLGLADRMSDQIFEYVQRHVAQL